MGFSRIAVWGRVSARKDQVRGGPRERTVVQEPVGSATGFAMKVPIEVGWSIAVIGVANTAWLSAEV